VWLLKLGDRTGLAVGAGIGSLVILTELGRWGWRQVRAGRL
jgi:hypothetical protein